jgi:hypothetical protein
MDTLASLALAAEAPDESVLNREPHKKDERIISGVISLAPLLEKLKILA